MAKQDARSLKNEALHERRKQVIRLLRHGESRAQIGRLTDLSPSAVAKIIRLYESGGDSALIPGQRGRKAGDDRRLTREQEAEVQKIICTATPLEFQLPHLVWTRVAIKQLIELKFGVNLAVRTVGHYLKRWDFALKKTPMRVHPQKGRDEDSSIPDFNDEQSYVRGYAPKGKLAKAFSIKQIASHM